MSHYTVGYHDGIQNSHEICEYANNAYEAVKNAQEDVPYLKGHPLSIDYALITEEEQLKHCLLYLPL